MGYFEFHLSNYGGLFLYFYGNSVTVAEDFLCGSFLTSSDILFQIDDSQKYTEVLYIWGRITLKLPEATSREKTPTLIFVGLPF